MARDSEPLDCHDVLEKKSNEASPPASSGDVMYPPMEEAIPILLALCMAMFLYALVSSTGTLLQILITLQNLTSFANSTNWLAGSQHHRNRHSPSH